MKGTSEMLALLDERLSGEWAAQLGQERHVDWAETQRELIAQTGLQNYLATRG